MIKRFIKKSSALLPHVVVSLGLILSLPVNAQTNRSDAGEILRQIERDRDLEKYNAPRTPPEIEEEKKEEIKKTGPTFKVQRFIFEGNQLILSSELEKALAEHLNKDITIEELKLAVSSLSNYYRDKGYLAQTSLPEQDITDGVVKVMITEAKFGSTRMNEEDKLDTYYVNPNIITQIINSHNPQGKPLNLDQLDRALLIANDLPGVSVQGGLQAGQKEGETDSVLTIKNKSRWNASLMADNFGSRATGYRRILGSATLVSPLRIGDKVNMTVLNTEGTDYVRLDYSLPVGGRGLRLGVNGSYLEYEVLPVSDPTRLKPRGYATTAQLVATYPLYRTRLTNLNVESNLQRMQYKNNNNLDGLQSDYSVNYFTLGLNGDRSNAWLLGGTTLASLMLDSAKTDIDAQASGLNLENGRFNRWRYNLNHTQFVQNDLSLTWKFYGQGTNQNLNSSERFFLGGTAGVRAYPTAEGSGSAGYVMNLEARKELPYNFSLLGFYDFGHVKQKVEQVDARNSYNLKGYGLAIDWQGPYRSNVSLIWARRIGNNPNPTDDLNDQDGTRHLNRFWVKASVGF
jgi:hemolysin activation/secretion protein